MGAVVAEGQTSGKPVLSTPEGYHFDKLHVTHSDGGKAATRPVLDGVLPTGEFLEVHETTLQPGEMPHPAHRHRHTELVLIREGTLLFYNDDKTETMGPGDVIQTGSTFCMAGRTSERLRRITLSLQSERRRRDEKDRWRGGAAVRVRDRECADGCDGTSGWSRGQRNVQFSGKCEPAGESAGVSV